MFNNLKITYLLPIMIRDILYIMMCLNFITNCYKPFICTLIYFAGDMVHVSNEMRIHHIFTFMVFYCQNYLTNREIELIYNYYKLK